MSYEYVYYNCLINNIDQESDDTYSHEPDLIFNEMRDGPIITNCKIMIWQLNPLKLILKHYQSLYQP